MASTATTKEKNVLKHSAQNILANNINIGTEVNALYNSPPDKAFGTILEVSLNSDISELFTSKINNIMIEDLVNNVYDRKTNSLNSQDTSSKIYALDTICLNDYKTVETISLEQVI